jgi:hypothetical protein
LPALFAVGLIAPALAGCPGHLEEIAWVISDAGPSNQPNTPIAEPPPVTPDAAVPTPPPTYVPTPDLAPASPPPPPGPDLATCSKPDEVFTKILLPNCGNAMCHGGAMPKAGLIFDMPGAKGRMLMAMAKNAMCTGQPLVTADGLAGVFLNKIQGTGCGNQMPFNKPPLSADNIACLKEWLKPAAMMPPPPAAVVDSKTCAQPAEIVGKIFMPKCSMCHGNMAPPAGLDLTSQGVRGRLLNIASKSPKSGCAGKPLMVADGTGVLIDKVKGMTCGVQMPAMGTPLTSQEVWCLQEWIKPGAGGTFPDAPVAGQPPVMATCASAQEISDKILKPKCLPCHAKAMPAQGLDLESAGSKGRLIGVASKGCMGKPLANADGSGVLFDKVLGPLPMGCGMPMPYGGLSPLNAAEVECLKAWITTK